MGKIEIENDRISPDIEQKDAIADAFKKHFNHFGLKKTSVDDVAKELKMSKKTIYKHFSTKEKIFYYIVSQVAKTFSRQMANKIKSYKTSSEKISALVNLIFIETKKWIKEGNDAFEFKYKFEIAEIAFKDAYNIIFEEIIAEGAKNGEFNSSDISLTISFINGVFSESMRLVQTNPDKAIEKNVIDAILRLLK
jgi:AcrR family transcriptional regulator